MTLDSRLEILPPAPLGLPEFPGYQVIGELGHGGMGVVYKAIDLKRQEVIALKTLQRVDPAALYRLKQEFRALTDVVHPNLVALHELISDGQRWFFTMELVEGVHFLDHIRWNADMSAPIPVAQVERLRHAMRQLAEGVSALHNMGKLHRDIKPSNIRVVRDGRVVLLDFGLAAELDSAGVHQSTDEHAIGSVAYMAPEQSAGQAVSPASDWYGVGVILYEALTGRVPFSGPPVKVLLSKQNREPPPPRQIVASIPADLDALCVDLLRRSPVARPSGADVLRRLGATAQPRSQRPAAQTQQRTSFVGRARHLAALAEAYEATRQGHATAIHVQGRSGAGKSLLAQHYLDGLIQQGEAVVLAGKCYERESAPYKALDGLIDALCRYLRHLPTQEAQALLPREVHLLARVFSVLERVEAVAQAPGRRDDVVDPHDLRQRAFAALRGPLLARLGDRRPLVLFIDDLQWGDVDSAVQLAELFRPPNPPVLLLVACYRSEDVETSPCLRRLRRSLEQVDPALADRQLAVDPLSPDEAVELALALLGPKDPASRAQADTIARESGGNPYFVHVLVQCLAAGPGSVGRALATEDLTLDEVLWARIQTLPAEARRLLEVIAVSGQPMRLPLACRAAELGVDEHGPVTVLRSERLVRATGVADQAELETYHDRIRETIVAHLPPAAITDHHRRVATALEASIDGDRLASGTQVAVAESSGGDETLAAAARESKRTFDIAYHLDAAGEGARALPYALAAAEHARTQYALEIAEQHYRIAERGAVTADAPTRARVAENLGDVLMLRGRYNEAGPRFAFAAAQAVDTLARVRLAGKLGELAFKRGDTKQATEAYEQALALIGKRVPRWYITFALLLVWEALVQLLHTLLPRLFVARRRLAGAETELLAVRLYNRLAYAYWFHLGKVPCLWAHLHCMNRAERYPPTPELAQAYSNHAPVMGLVPLFARGIAYGEKSLAIRIQLGDLWGQGQSLHFLGVLLYAAARYAECIDRCREAVRLLDRTGDPWEVNIARYHIAVSLYRQGDLRGAAEQAQRVYRAAIDLGDSQGSGISLDVWARSTHGKVSAAVIKAELDRPSHDIQRTAQVMQAEAARLLEAGQPAEAAAVLKAAQRVVRKGGLKNVYVTPILPWLATALRLQAVQDPDRRSRSRKRMLRRAWAAAGAALRVARTFQGDLPHALRETALLEVLRGHAPRARRYFDESLAVAERQGARFEHAQTLLCRGQTGVRLGWPGSAEDMEQAQSDLHAIEDSG